MIRKLLVILLSVLGVARSAPATYDQRQEGDLNVKVDLDNFVVLVARPSSTSLDLFGAMAQLLSDARRAPSPGSPEAEPSAKVAEEEAAPGEAGPPAEPLAEASAAALEQPEAHEPEEKVLVVVQEGEKTARSLETIVRTLRNLKGKEALLEKERAKAQQLQGKYKLVDSVEEPQSLKLIGEAVENCGPGRSRDHLGICQAQD